MKSKRSHEGYIQIDHRNSPGMAEPLVVQAGLPPGAGIGMFEAPAYKCSHCQRIVVIEPQRTRERGYCSKCDHLVCDGCNEIRVKTGACVTFKQIMDSMLEAAVRETLIKEI